MTKTYDFRVTYAQNIAFIDLEQLIEWMEDHIRENQRFLEALHMCRNKAIEVLGQEEENENKKEK